MDLSNLVIRSAVAEDMGGVIRLIQELADYENASDQVSNTESQLVEDGFGNDPVFKCNVAEINDDIIGFTLYYTSYSTWKGRCLYLEDFIVTERYRRTGVGKMLFEKLLDHAKEIGAARFEWQVLDWNKPAINFYNKYKSEMDGTWINCRLALK